MSLRIKTQIPVALHTVDHLYPRGTLNDNSTNTEFNRRLYAALEPITPRILDLGCSGGGFVESVLSEGRYAVGVEGSDRSKHLGRAAWGRIPESLFTADIREPFLLLTDKGFVQRFDVVTMWEVLEHIGEAYLDNVNVNLHAHTDDGAHLIVSITTESDRFEGHEYHATIRPIGWWREFFLDRGWKEDPYLYAAISPQWVRGPNTQGDASSVLVLTK